VTSAIAAVTGDQLCSVATGSALSSRTSWAIDRGLAIGAQRARITFQPFCAFAA
jgi:hypothetical protein